MHAGRRLCRIGQSRAAALHRLRWPKAWWETTDWQSDTAECSLGGVNTAKSNNVIWTAFFNVIFAVVLSLFILLYMVFEGKQPMGIQLPEVKEMILLWKHILMLFIFIRTLIDFNYHAVIRTNKQSSQPIMIYQYNLIHLRGLTGLTTINTGKHLYTFKRGIFNQSYSSAHNSKHRCCKHLSSSSKRETTATSDKHAHYNYLSVCITQSKFGAQTFIWICLLDIKININIFKGRTGN